MKEVFYFTCSVLEPSGPVIVCPGDNATFTCMTTGGVQLWETNIVPNKVFFNDPNNPTSLGKDIQLKVVGFAQRMFENVTILEINSTATATNVLNTVLLNCSETTSSNKAWAVLIIAGKL